MALTEQDKDWIKLVSRELAFEAIKEVLKEHVKSCPHGQSLMAMKMFFVGCMIGSGIAGGGIAAAIMKLI